MGTKMDDTPNLYLSALLELSVAGLRYSLIRGGYDSKRVGDLDIIVFDGHMELLESMGYMLFSYQENNYKYIKFDIVSGDWIHLDVYTAISFGKLTAPDSFTRELLRTSYKDDYGVNRLSEDHEQILLIFHVMANKRLIDEKYVDYIYRETTSSLVDMAKCYEFLPNPLSKYLNILKLLQQGEIDENFAIQNVSNDFVPLEPRNRGFFYKIYKRLLSVLRGNQAIVILGPDGSGKSTLTDALVRLKWPTMRRQYMGPARIENMRRPFRVMLIYLSSMRDKWPKTSILGILSRIGWQLTCYLDFLERVYRHVYFWGSGGIVLFDRYPCDMYFRKPTKINEIIFLKFFPKPKFVFLCVGDAKLIYKRKPEELSCSDIDRTIMLYRKQLSRYAIKFIEVDTTELSQEAVLNKVTRNLIEYNWYRL